MNGPIFNEFMLEQAALAWLESLGYKILSGPEIAPGEPGAERETYDQVVLAGRLREAMQRLNPDVPAAMVEDAVRLLMRTDRVSLVENNRSFHERLTGGVTVQEVRRGRGATFNQLRVVDFEHIENNDFVVVNQFTVMEGGHHRRFDIVVFLNGLPVGVFELKNPAAQGGSLLGAWQQLETYKEQIPSLFVYNEVLVIANGLSARAGTLTAPYERFFPWRAPRGGQDNGAPASELEELIRGIFDKRNLLELVRYFIVFEDAGGGRVQKKMAGYHQFYAVNAAMESVLKACKHGGEDKGKGGVIWHTQGSGKSLTMAFFAGRLCRSREMDNPMVVVITDRNDLDDQLFEVFSRCHELLGQPPTRAESRAQLRTLLATTGGRVVFTTVQKFFQKEENRQNGALSERENVVVIADEAHRSQYDFIDGFARHMRDALPNATFVGFTGTPLELDDRDTRRVFGDYIHVYDIEQAVRDGATVHIYYESRLAQLALDEAERPRLDEEFEELTEEEELSDRARMAARWTQLERLAGAPKRIREIARDLIGHFEQRQQAIAGKAMVVCMSRKICVELYKEIVRLRPDWGDADDEKGRIKIVMTGSAMDPPEWQEHIRDKRRRERLAARFKDPEDPFHMVIVRDMWLTGFDAPCLHTIYIDKPMRGHTLMQAIARVNRVFGDKPGGLVVDYIGFAHELKAAIQTYTSSGGRGRAAINQQEAVEVLLEKIEICRGLLFGFDYSGWMGGSPQERTTLLARAANHILGLEDGKQRFMKAAAELSRAHKLAVPHQEALKLRDEVKFFLLLRNAFTERGPMPTRTRAEIEAGIEQLLSRAVVSEGVVDLLAAAGLKKPDISIFSDEFLDDVRGLPYRHLGVELLQRLIQGQIQERSRRNVVEARSFTEQLEKALQRYHSRTVDTALVIEELIKLARQIREAGQKGERLGLTEDEVAFYDALASNESAVEVLGDKKLRIIAQELTRLLRNSVTIDWTIREDVRAQIRVNVRRLLRRHGYPPDQQEEATRLVLEQAETLCEEWTEEPGAQP
jgi:type I restriction enzyme R subunit